MIYKYARDEDDESDFVPSSGGDDGDENPDFDGGDSDDGGDDWS